MIPAAAKQRDLFSRRYRTVIAPRVRESALQIQLVSMLRWCLRPDVLFWHTPNGEQRDPRTAAKLKAMGVLPGVSDLQFHWCELDAFAHNLPPDHRGGANKIRRVLHMELKADAGRQTEAQASFALAMRLLGDEYHIVRNIDEALELLRERGLLRSDVKIRHAGMINAK
jgi:hypothetical protein